MYSMGHRINAEVVYFKSNKNSCLLDKLKEIDRDISVDRKGAKKQKRVRYTIHGFDSIEHIDQVEQQVTELLQKAPIKDWSIKQVSVAV